MKFTKFILLADILLMIFIFNSCDLSVDNPGPVNDKELDNEDTFPGLVGGMARNFGIAQNWLAFQSAFQAKEDTAAGSTGSYGITLAQRQGNLLSSEMNTEWNNAQRARWVAEHGIKRMKKELGEKFSSSELGARALLWSGYANRLLGENMCKAVIDGGPAKKNNVYFNRAEKDFTDAIEILKKLNNTKLLTAAFGGRSSVRIYLDKWKKAVNDAKQVPVDFVYASQRSDTKELEYNRFYWANANKPYRTYSEIGTYYEGYYEKYNDPRVSWNTNPDIPYGDGGTVPWLFQTKYTKESSPINLSSGDEMILIRAEAKLRSDEWQEALDLINSIRQEVGVKPWKANNETEAWTRLKRERGIELWLEARRLGDLRRWTENNTPGKMEDMSGRDLCFPIGQDELETNKNL